MKVLKAQQIKDAKHSGVGKAPLKLSDGNGLQLHVFDVVPLIRPLNLVL